MASCICIYKAMAHLGFLFWTALALAGSGNCQPGQNYPCLEDDLLF